MCTEVFEPFVLHESSSGSWRHRERRKGTQDCTRNAVLSLFGSWNIYPVKRGWGSWVCSTWRRDSSRGTQQQLPVPMGRSLRVQSWALGRDAQRRKDRYLEQKLGWKVEGAGGRGKGWRRYITSFLEVYRQLTKSWAARVQSWPCFAQEVGLETFSNLLQPQQVYVFFG